MDRAIHAVRGIQVAANAALLLFTVTDLARGSYINAAFCFTVAAVTEALAYRDRDWPWPEKRPEVQ